MNVFIVGIVVQFGIVILYLKTLDMKVKGIIHICHCGNCGAQIEYYIPLSDSDDVDDDKENE